MMRSGINTKYGKFEGDIFLYAPKVLQYEGYEIINPTEEQYLEAGYKKIVYTPQPEPEEGYYYTSNIVNIDGIPTQVWEKHKIEENIDE